MTRAVAVHRAARSTGSPMPTTWPTPTRSGPAGTPRGSGNSHRGSRDRRCPADPAARSARAAVRTGLDVLADIAAKVDPR
jgi:hypothetical protein